MANSKLIVSDLDFDMASRVAKEIKSAGGNAEPFKLDVTNQNETIENMKNAYEHFGSLDIAFCNAGIREIVSPLELSIEELSLIHISEPTRLLSISYAVFCV